MNDITRELDTITYDAELVDNTCELNLRGCTHTGHLVEDPYEAEVYGNHGLMIVTCDNCYESLSDSI